MTRDLFSCIPQPVAIHRVIPSCCQDGTDKLAASLILFDEEGFCFLVKPAQVPNTWPWFSPVQVTLKRTDYTFADGLRRALVRKLGCPDGTVSFQPTEVNRYVNHVPERRNQPAHRNFTLVFAGQVPSDRVFQPNPKAIREMVRVRPNELLLHLPPRRDKFCGTLDAWDKVISTVVLPIQQAA